MIPMLKDHYTVYTIDLLGCGRSEKPNLTYTNFLYVQLISDFIKSEIGRRTDVVAVGASSSILTMACAYNPDLFDQSNNLSTLKKKSVPSILINKSLLKK